MGSSDRRPYLTATVLDQAFLDACRDSLENDLRLIVEIPTDDGFARRTPVTAITIAAPGVVTASDHRFIEADPIKFEGSGTLPPEIVIGTTYFTKNLNSEAFQLSLTAGGAAITTTGSFAAPISVYAASPVIRASDRNLFVGPRFYEALTEFPIIARTLGEWLSPVIEFSGLGLRLSNVDGRFNPILPAGANYAGWIGRQIDVKLGLRDVISTYQTLFSGKVSEVGGFRRNIRSIDVTARDKFDELTVQFPNTVVTKTGFSFLEDADVGLIVPYILGDWTTEVLSTGSIPTIIANGADPDMNGNTSNTNNVQLIISINALESFDTTKVFVRKGDTFTQIDVADVVTTGAFPTSGATNARFEIKQGGTTPLTFESGDEYFVFVKGTTLGGGSLNNNAVEQAKKILFDFTSVTTSDLDSNVDTFRDKAAPAQSAVSLIKSRVWIQDPKPVMEFVLSLLEQIRLELFISRDLLLKINPIHFEDWDDSPAFRVRQHDVGENTFKLGVDEQNNFTLVQGFYSLEPTTGENAKQTSRFKNSVAIAQDGKNIEKQAEFPNLYIESDVKNQIIEIVRLGSAKTELINLDLTWRAMLLDLGDFVKINVTIGSTTFNDVPAMIREIGVDPNGVRIPTKIWSYQLFPFKTFNPGFTGIVSSDSATITEE